MRLRCGILAATLMLGCLTGCGEMPMDAARAPDDEVFTSMPPEEPGAPEEDLSGEQGDFEEAPGEDFSGERGDFEEPEAPVGTSSAAPMAPTSSVPLSAGSSIPPRPPGTEDPNEPPPAPLSPEPEYLERPTIEPTWPGPMMIPESSSDITTSAQSESDDDYVEEKIYYGTNRAPEVTDSERWKDYQTAARRFKILLVSGLALCGAAFYLARRRYLLFVPAALCLIIAAWFGRQAMLEQQQADRDDQHRNRRYGDAIHLVNGQHILERGYCWVSVPKVHTQGSGQLERPSLLELKEDPERHFTLQRVEQADRESFLADLKASVANSSAKHAFVFIHGYNVTFRNAALRTAQLRYDLGFDGPAALFSWPSNGSLLSYASDEETVNLTDRSGVLDEFLTDFIDETGAESIHLVAHSMGNRLLTRTIGKLPHRLNSQGQPVISQFIMAAPDVNPDEFRLLADHIKDMTRARTLYASEKDIALLGSEVLRMSNYTRLGQGGENRVIVDGVQTIDASDLDQAVFDLGHSYYVHPQVMQDLRHLLTADQVSLIRPWLVSLGDYWVFRQH